MQIPAWLRLCPSPAVFAQMAVDGRWTLVAEKDGAMQGFADVEPDGHIKLFYCAPEAVGTRVAPAIYAEIETIALRLGIVLLYSEASEAARRFFAHWICPVFVPLQVLVYATFRSKATGLFQPNAEWRRRGL